MDPTVIRPLPSHLSLAPWLSFFICKEGPPQEPPHGVVVRIPSDLTRQSLACAQPQPEGQPRWLQLCPSEARPARAQQLEACRTSAAQSTLREATETLTSELGP